VLTVAMAFAAVYGAVQLAALAWPTRSVGLGTLLLSVGVGVYGAGVVGVLLQLAYTRSVAAISSEPLSDVVRTASYTVDPFIEELIKIVPLLVLGMYARSRLQWCLTDYLVVGAGIGAGFGLLEAVLRFSHRVENALATGSGWILPTSIAPPYIPGFGTTLTSWLPAPVTAEFLTAFPEPETSVHLVWSALAGFGVGILFRMRGSIRLLGLLPFLLVSVDHAAHNYDLTLTGKNLFGTIVAAPFVAAQPLRWLWPLVALGIALWIDLRTLQRGLTARPELLLAAERGRDWLGRLVAIPRYAAYGLPWTGLVAVRFVRMRRAALYDAAGRSDPSDPMIRLVADVRAKLDVTSSAAAWKGRGIRELVRLAHPPGKPGWLKRYWPLLAWGVLMLPALVYFGLGSTPGLTVMQDLIGSTVIFPLVAVLSVAGLLWVGWNLLVAIRAVPAALKSPEGSVFARVQMQLGMAAGAAALGAVCLVSWVGGTRPDDQLISNFHVLDALSDALLAVGIALLLGAFIFFPPFGAVALATGGVVIVPTITTGFVTMGTLGVASILLSQAAGSVPTPSSGGRGGGGGGGQSSQGIPQAPPRPKPQVRHWRLRRIVDDLWKGTTNPNRVGDGTTMDAVRNEIRTNVPTHGRFHSNKAREAINALDNWLRRYGPEATRTDRLWARQLRQELQRALEGR